MTERTRAAQQTINACPKSAAASGFDEHIRKSERSAMSCTVPSYNLSHVSTHKTDSTLTQESKLDLAREDPARNGQHLQPSSIPNNGLDVWGGGAVLPRISGELAHDQPPPQRSSPTLNLTCASFSRHKPRSSACGRPIRLTPLTVLLYYGWKK